MRSRPAYSPARSSRIGLSLWQGPHHSAQKSTSTGMSLPSTSSAKVASVTSAGMSAPLKSAHEEVRLARRYFRRAGILLGSIAETGPVEGGGGGRVAGGQRGVNRGGSGGHAG